MTSADRLLSIEHSDVLDLPMLRIDYVWNNDNTLDSRTETDAVASETAVVSFSYDNRGRLIGDSRVVDSTTVYDILYTYDQLGNRLSKIDYGPDPDRKTLYHYDSDPNNRDPEYPTNNNRLLWYEEYVDDGGWTLTRTVSYTYYQVGHVSNITIKDEYPGVGDPNDYEWYRDLALYYNSNHELWRVLWDCWKVNGQGQVTNYQKLSAREFYYDSPRRRHMWRDVNPDTLEPNYPTHTEHWTDYAGQMPYADFEMTLYDQDPNYDVQVAGQTAYLAASGVNAQQTVVDPNVIMYLHGDLIDSTMLLTDGNGQADSSGSYTAFGDFITLNSEFDIRYAYAGGWGYESGLLTLEGVPGSAPITLQHVGARWYQPDIGRFVQRDPIGIFGGLNLYAYCAANPLGAVDPSGLGWDWWTGGDTVRRHGWNGFVINLTGGWRENWWDGPGPKKWGDRAAIVGFGTAGLATCLYIWGVDFGIKAGIHGAHHFFPEIGRKAAHLQLNWWRVGVRGSGGARRWIIF